MKKRKLKSAVIPVFLVSLATITLLVTLLITKPNNSMQENNVRYVTDTIISRELPVINTAIIVGNPFNDSSVTVGKSYYNYEGTKEDQEKSIIYHENTYIQNTGVDYVSDKQFEIISVLDGTVTNVKEDELLGKVVEITYNNDYIAIYQSLDSVNVKKGDSVMKGQVIGTSGTNKLDKDLGNHLHFEFCIGGQIVDPQLYLNKELPAINQ